MKLIRLTEQDLVRLAALTEMGDKACEMAKGFLVDHRTLPEVAAEHKVTRQRVHLAVESIRKQYMKEKLDTGWLELELELPHTLASGIERLANAYSQQPDVEVREAVLAKVIKAILAAERALSK